jgi:hypothetical protein
MPPKLMPTTCTGVASGQALAIQRAAASASASKVIGASSGALAP